MYLIDRGELLMKMMHKFHYELPDGCNNPLYGDVIKVIEDAPLIEADPVRHGRWIEHDDGVFTCSECGNAESIESYFCRYCGAEMDKEE